MKIPKSEVEYNMKSIRFLLLTITTMFVFISILMIILGISVYSQYHDFSFLYESAKTGHFFTPSIMVVVLGVIMLVVTLFGFFGSLRESTCMVNLYALILFLVLIIELSVVIIAFTMEPTKVQKMLNVPVEDYTTDLETQMEIDFVQRTLNCCGGSSYLDYATQVFNETHNAVKLHDYYFYITISVPRSCCLHVENEFCIRIRETGCNTALVDMILQNTSVLGVMGVSVVCVQLLGIIFALLLARSIRKLKSERGLSKWTEREKEIIARDTKKVHWLENPGSTEA